MSATISTTYKAFRETSPEHNSTLTVAELITELENRLFEYNSVHRHEQPPRYKAIHIPELNRMIGIIEGVSAAFKEFHKQ